MNKTIIPAGYRLTVSTWENDADNYNNEILEGLTLEKTAFLVELCKQLSSKNSSSRGIGNLYEPDDRELAKVAKTARALFEKFPNVMIEEDFELDLSDDGEVRDALLEFAYEIGASNTEFYTRVVESWKVEYIPTDIVMEDVTEKFE